MKKIYLLFFVTIILFMVNSCTKDEETNDIITTDISVTSSEQNFGWVNSTDLNAKLNLALSYNYGNVLENEIDKVLTFNSDTTRVVVTINFKENVAIKYFDQNISNNTVIVDLVKSIPVNVEGSFASNFSIASPPWSNCDITYSFMNYTKDITQSEQIAAFASAAQAWANLIDGLSINNIGFNNPNADIRILFTDNSLHTPCPATFRGALAHAYFPSSTDSFNGSEGDIHFNDKKKFSNSTSSFPIYDFETVSLHELGHSLGLNHSNIRSAIMYDFITPFIRQTQLNEDDINGLTALYNGTSCSNNTGNSFINITPNNWTFDDTQINSTSSPKEFIITNNGSKSFDVTNITTNNTNFEIVGGQSGTISPSGEITFNIVFNPLQIQTYDGVITIDNTADNANSSIQVTGTGIDNNSNTSIISLSGNLNFGDVEVNQSATRTLTISNSGTANFNVSSISNPNGFSSNYNGIITAGNSVDVTVTFAPTSEQDYNGTISVNSNADDGSGFISCSGTGTSTTSNTSTILLSGNLNFPDTEIGSSSERTLTISNSGNQSFNVSNINFPNSVYSSSWSSGTINGGGSQNVTVTFQPTNEQSYNGNVTISHNADNGNNIISINGSGVNNNSGQPNLRFYEFDIQDDNNNNNGIIEAGEDIDFDIRLENFGRGTATNIEAIISTTDPEITITDNDRTYDDMPQGDLEWNGGAFDFQVSSSCPTKTVTFTIQINSNEGSWSDSFTVDVQGQSGGLPEVYAEYSPRDNCSSTGSSDNYRLDLNTIYYRDNWNIDNIISYGSDGKRAMWYRFRTIDKGSYTINLTMNGDPGFELFTACGASSVATKDSSNGNSETGTYTINENTDIYIRFYDNNDNSNIDFDISIEH